MPVCVVGCKVVIVDGRARGKCNTCGADLTPLMLLQPWENRSVRVRMAHASSLAQFGVLLVASIAIGCAGKSSAPAPEAPAVEAPANPKPEPVAVTPAEPEAPCASDRDCVDKGKALAESGDDAGARELYQVGCDAGGGQSCERWASSISDDDPELAASLWEKACAQDVLNACFNAAEKVRESDPEKAVGLYAKACSPDGDVAMLRSLACSRGGITAYGAKKYADAKTMAEALCTEAASSGCGLLGVLYAQGRGVSADVQKAKVLLDKGCKGGDKEACGNLAAVEAAVKASEMAAVLAVDGANVTIGSITVDGLAASDLQCRRDGGGGLFGGAMGAISGISKRKGKLMKCASSPEDVRVRWTAKGGKIKTVEAKGSSAKVESCVKKAIKGSSAAFGGTCAATFSIGG